MKTPKKSPLKGRPLRYTGQSLDEEIDDLINEKGMVYLFAIIVAAYSTFMAWNSYYKPAASPPIAITVFFFFVILYCVYRLYRLFKKLKVLKLGRDGERVVGQYLEALREKGYRIFHDIVGSSFNIDHVIISKKGIFVIETKTYSKPVRKEPQPVIHYDGEKVLIDGQQPKSDILTQVKAASSWLKEVIDESTGQAFDIMPVIVFPGWFIENPGNHKGETWVLNPKALGKYISNRQDILSQEDVMLASFHVSRFIRTTRKK